MDVMDKQDFTRQKLNKGFTVILYYHNEVLFATLCIQIHGCVKQTNIISRQLDWRSTQFHSQI